MNNQIPMTLISHKGVSVIVDTLGSLHFWTDYFLNLGGVPVYMPYTGKLGTAIQLNKSFVQGA